jgi:DNA polymerase-1
LIGISFSIDSKAGWYIPVGHQGLNNASQLPLKTVLEKLRSILENERPVKTAFNLKNQILILRNHGIDLKGALYDPMVQSYVLNPTRHGHRMEELAKEYMQYQAMAWKDFAGTGQKHKAAADLDMRVLADFGCEFTDSALEVTSNLERDLQKEGMDQFYWDVEHPLIRVLAEVEWNGVKVDLKTLERLSQEMGKNVDRLVAEIYELAGGEFNINSPKTDRRSFVWPFEASNG